MDTSSPRPPEGNIILHWLWKLIFTLIGWRVEGRLPNLPRFVLIGAPHTSNWDGVLLMGVARVARINIAWLGKQALFKPPFGWLMRRLGGIPIDRSAHQNAVEQAVQAFQQRDRLVLVIAPEGTRSKASHWKTGFYYIAQGAGVPIVMGTLDYKRRRAVFGPALVPSGDIEADMRIIAEFYAGITPRHPEKVGPITLAPPDSAR